MVARGDITWKLAPDVVTFVQPIRQRLGEQGYGDTRRGLQDHLCGYFTANTDCTREQGDAISPMGAPTEPGWKCLKVRWLYPGCGSSGGLRLAVTVHCDEEKVNIVGAWRRKDNPQTEDFKQKFAVPDPEPDDSPTR